MKTIDLQRKHGLMLSDVEALRSALGGTFLARQSKIVRDYRSRILRIEPISEWTRHKNLVVNEGIDRTLTNQFASGTQITAWKLLVFKTNTTITAGLTYASPSFTECTTTNLDEATRQAWTPGSIGSHAYSNSASPAVYTGDDAHTIYGAAIVGGGSAASTLGDTAGGGSMHCASNFGAKAMDVDVQLAITWALGNADDGV